MLLLSLLVVPCLLGGCPRASNAPPPVYSDDGVSVYFSPKGGCTDAIVDQIDQARSTIEIQAYSFTSTPIAKAIVAAHNRGVKVRAVLDSSQRTEKYSSATFVHNAGIPTYIDAQHKIAHNKIILIDRATLITGSFNFSNAAEKENAENLLIIHARPKLVEVYEQNFENHLKHSTPYSRN